MSEQELLLAKIMNKYQTENWFVNHYSKIQAIGILEPMHGSRSKKFFDKMISFLDFIGSIFITFSLKMFISRDLEGVSELIS